MGVDVIEEGEEDRGKLISKGVVQLWWEVVGACGLAAREREDGFSHLLEGEGSFRLFRQAGVNGVGREVR